MRLERKIVELLTNARKTLAIAESCTGGLLSNRLTNIPGSSAFLKFSLVSYSNEAKTKILGVPQTLIQKHGAVSSQTALSMARRARKLLKTDLGIAITGIAGPSGGTRAKPIGLTFIAVASELDALCLEYRLTGNRIHIKNQAANLAMRALLGFLE